jgi:hypothetical protein
MMYQRLHALQHRSLLIQTTNTFTATFHSIPLENLNTSPGSNELSLINHIPVHVIGLENLKPPVHIPMNYL